MTSQPPEAAPSILVVEAPAGAARRSHLEALAAAAGAGWETHVVSARLDLQGAWAGVHDLFRAFLPRLRAARDAAAAEVERITNRIASLEERSAQAAECQSTATRVAADLERDRREAAGLEESEARRRGRCGGRHR